jgi:hypothetical protein
MAAEHGMARALSLHGMGSRLEVATVVGRDRHEVLGKRCDLGDCLARVLAAHTCCSCCWQRQRQVLFAQWLALIPTTLFS